MEALEAADSTRITALENRLDSLLKAVEVMRSDTRKAVERVGSDVRAAIAEASSSSSSGPSDVKMKRIIQVAFSKFDEDKSGRIDLAELGAALSELTSSSVEGALSFDTVSGYMRRYDANASGGLDVDEFTLLLRDLARTGKLELNEELQREVNLLAADDSPWAICLRGDRTVQEMVRSVRSDCDNSAQSRARWGRRRRWGGTPMRRASSEDAGSFRGRDGLSRREGSFRADPMDEGGSPAAPASSGLGIGTVLGAALRGAGSPLTSNSPPAASRKAGVAAASVPARPLRRQLCRRLCRVLPSLPVLSPNSRFHMCWALLMAALICYCAVTVPLELAFETSMRRGMGADGWRMWEACNLAVDCVFIADILLSFRTGFIVDGQLMRDGWLVARHYLLRGFVIDVLGAFPVNFLQDALRGESDEETSGGTRLNRNLRLLRMVKLNRLLRLSKLSRYLKYLELMLSFNPSALRVFKLLVLMLACCHWMGCVWWFASEMELELMANPLEPYSTWQPSAELLRSQSIGPQFAAAFFWGTGFITAMLPYDIVPQTEVENYVTVCCMAIGMLFNAYVIGSMATALSSLDSKKQICRGKLETIGHYLLLHNVNSELRAKILEYYE